MSRRLETTSIKNHRAIRKNTIDGRKYIHVILRVVWDETGLFINAMLLSEREMDAIYALKRRNINQRFLT